MSDVLVRVEDVSKKFCKSLKQSMMYGIKDIGRSMIGMSPRTDELRPCEFWSVDSVSFEVKRGECIGLIGPNGAGKSTLLKILNGIIPPDKGQVEIKGRVGALIDVTVGFHPMLTGRENIYVSGSILGFSKKEIDKKFDDIVEFSELGDFIDTPIKHYSSGMNVRLGFSIAAQMEPDVLLIDEVLAVGDAGFNAKCFNAIGRILRNAAVIFVSHQMAQVARICTDICVLNKGKIVYQGKDVPKGIEYYYSNFESLKNIITGTGRAKIHKIELESKNKNDVREINYLDDLTIHLHITIDADIKHPVIFVGFLNRGMQLIAQWSSLSNKVRIYNTGGQMHIKIYFPVLNFNPGVYLFSVSLLDEDQREILTYNYAIKELKVTGEFVGFAPVQLTGECTIYNHLEVHN